MLLLVLKRHFLAAHPVTQQTPETHTSSRTNGYVGPWSPNARWQLEGSLLGDIIDGALEPIRIGGDLIRAGTQLGSLGTHALGWTDIYEYEPHSWLMQGWFRACDEGRGGEYLREVELGVLTLGIKPLGEAIDEGDWRNVSRMAGDYLTAGGTMALLRPRPGRAPAATPVDRGVPHPSTPVGRSGNPLGDGILGTNRPTTIGGRPYSGHAIDRMQQRGIPPSVVENTIQHGHAGRGSTPGTVVYYDPVNNVSVVVDPTTRRILTVSFGDLR